MLDNNEAAMAKGMTCKESLEDIAARIKKQLDIHKNLYIPLVKYLESDQGYNFNSEERKTLYALVGRISMKVPRLEAEYQAYLARIEASEK